MTRIGLVLGFTLSLSSFASADVGPPPDLGGNTADMAAKPTTKSDEGCNVGVGLGAGSGTAILAALGLAAARRGRRAA